jgi:methyl-accepting chemotaxis protein
LTEEVATENEVSNVENNAGQGNFTQRVNLQGKEGFFLNLSTQINSLIQTSEVGLNDVARVLSALAKGDLKQRIMDFFNV